MKASRTKGKFEVGEKRFYLPYLLTGECPSCEHSYERDLSFDYLSFPVLGDVNTVDMYCYECEHEWVEFLFLDVKVEPQ